MDVILLERVEKLGQIGDVVTVKNGFARNYLLPNKKALRANAANKKVFEANRAKIESDNAAKRDEAAKASKDVDGTKVVLIRQASNTGQLYGSVSTRDIVEAMETHGHTVTKSQVVLGRPIKTIGLHEVRIVLHPEVSATISANVARSPEEAELQAQGVDILADEADRENDALAEAAAQVMGEDADAGDADAEADAGAEAEAEAEAPVAEAQAEEGKGEA